MFGYTGYKKSGFTLAEVLVTLGIIGIVATLTVPSMVMNYQRRIMESKLKKAYSIATNACERMLTEENVSRVNETEIYGKYGDDLNDNDIKLYFKTTKSGGNVNGKGYAINLPDSTVLYLKAENNGFTFYTDVDGADSGSNTAGVDLFEFKLDSNCSYDSNLGENPSDEATKFNDVVENDWKI